MTARDELYWYADDAHLGAAELDRLLDAYRAEVLREAAESVRRWAEVNEKYLLEGERSGALMAANHISPFTAP
jgi:hypothetical protein